MKVKEQVEDLCSVWDRIYFLFASVPLPPPLHHLLSPSLSPSLSLVGVLTPELTDRYLEAPQEAALQGVFPPAQPAGA